MKNYKAAKLLSGRGYYLLLILCIAAAGVFTYAAVRNSLKNAAPEEGTPYDYENVEPEEMLPSPDEINLEENPLTTPEQTAAPEQKTEEPDTAPADTPPAEESSQVSNPVQPAKTQYLLPVAGDIVKPFSEDELVFSLTMNDYRVHNGIDIAAAVGTNVTAAADGTVESVSTDDLMGVAVVLTHGDGKKSVYSNLDTELPEGIAPGTTVKAGDTIGTVGNTALAEVSEAPHLHFAILSKDEYVNPEKLIK